MRVSCMCTAFEVVRDRRDGVLLVHPLDEEIPKGWDRAGYVLPERPMQQTAGVEQYLTNVPNLDRDAQGRPRQHYPSFDLAVCVKCGTRVAVGA